MCMHRNELAVYLECTLNDKSKVVPITKTDWIPLRFNASQLKVLKHGIRLLRDP